MSINFDLSNTVLVVIDAEGRIESDHEDERQALKVSDKVPGSQVARVTREWLDAYRSNQRL
jgi:hypothetical protein